MTRIALVEDNPDNCLLVEAILGDSFLVTIYMDGLQALAGLGQSMPDLILLDISLPGMDGLEVLQHLRADQAFAHLPILAMTAHAMQGDRERFLAAGFDDYIQKPILDERHLLEAIDRHLHLRAAA